MRRLPRWGGVAAAIVGVASLATAAVSLWKLVPSPAEIEASATACTADGVNFALHNIGDKPGAVRTVSLEIVADGAKQGERILLSPEPAGQIVMVEAGKSAQALYVRRVANAPAPILEDGQAKPCRYLLSIGTSGVQGSASETGAECKCPRPRACAGASALPRWPRWRHARCWKGTASCSSRTTPGSPKCWRAWRSLTRPISSKTELE